MFRAMVFATAVFTGAVVIVGTAIYLEFGLDIRTPRADVTMAGVLTPVNQISSERYIAVTRAMKAKYGDKAQTWIGPNGMTTKVDGQVVARRELTPVAFKETYGLTIIGANDQTNSLSLFPFRLTPDHVPHHPHDSFLPATLQAQYKHVLHSEYLHFTNMDYATEPCWHFGADKLALPLAARPYAFGKTTLCMVSWRRAPEGRLLIGITEANGGAWVRTLARGGCRMLAYAWLAGPAEAAQRPDYLQCILVDRPRQMHGNTVTAVYQLRQDGTLALAE